MKTFTTRLHEACSDEANPHIKYMDDDRVSVDLAALDADDAKFLGQVCPRAKRVVALSKQLQIYGFKRDGFGYWKHPQFRKGTDTHKQMHPVQPLKRAAPAVVGGGGQQQQQQQQQPGNDSSTGALAELKAQQQLHRQKLDALESAAATDRAQQAEMVKTVQQEMHERDTEIVQRQQQLSKELATVQHNIAAEQQARAADVRAQREYTDQSRLLCCNMMTNLRTELREKIAEPRESFKGASTLLLLERSQAVHGGGSSSTCAAASRAVAV
eukprot:11960-Heterococcus_DN1.PRE.3